MKQTFKTRVLAKSGAVLIALALISLILTPVMAQYQTGASAVTISQGGNSAVVDAAGALKSNIAEVGGAAVTLGQAAMASSIPVVIASNQGAIPISGSIANTSFGITGAIPAGSNVIGTVKQAPVTAGCGSTGVDSGLSANVAITGTVLLASATCVDTLFISNTTANTVTYTLTDNQGSPATYISGFPLAGNSFTTIPLHGIKMLGGVKLTAGTATSLNAQVWGVQ